MSVSSEFLLLLWCSNVVVNLYLFTTPHSPMTDFLLHLHIRTLSMFLSFLYSSCIGTADWLEWGHMVESLDGAEKGVSSRLNFRQNSISKQTSHTIVPCDCEIVHTAFAMTLVI
ncbi:hypothetical protein AMECASPLE_023005 [Ameca splendens]|uniref:Secreted protein n=1 Tax=Ameca splendens TaxID=208324 RepID=A0ABV1A1M2_9TELE